MQSYRREGQLSMSHSSGPVFLLLLGAIQLPNQSVSKFRKKTTTTKHRTKQVGVPLLRSESTMVSCGVGLVLFWTQQLFLFGF